MEIHQSTNSTANIRLFFEMSKEMSEKHEKYYRFKKFLREIVDIPNILDLSCKPLSDVSIIGFSSLYFSATERIMLSGER